MFKEISFNRNISISLQIKDYIKELILKGMLQRKESLLSLDERSDSMVITKGSGSTY